MTNHKDNNSIKETVLARIESGKAVMRPKWHFILKGSLFALGLILVILALSYLTSFLLFILREAGVLFIPAFGFRGLGAFLVSVPWVLVLIAAVFLFLLEILVRHYSFAYKRPLLYSLIGVVGVVVLGSAVVLWSGVHENFSQHAEESDLPLFGPLYRGYLPESFDQVRSGVVQELFDGGFTLADRHDDTYRIHITSDTVLAPGLDLRVGSSVIVWGESEGSLIEAIGIRPAPHAIVPQDMMYQNLRFGRTPAPLKNNEF